MSELVLLALVTSAGAADWSVAACDGGRDCVERRVELSDRATVTLAFERPDSPRVELDARRLAPRRSGEEGASPGEGRFAVMVVDHQGKELGGGTLTLSEGYAPGTIRTRYGFLGLRVVTVEIAPAEPGSGAM